MFGWIEMSEKDQVLTMEAPVHYVETISTKPVKRNTDFFLILKQ
jgi:hypothetical protein